MRDGTKITSAVNSRILSLAGIPKAPIFCYDDLIIREWKHIICDQLDLVIANTQDLIFDKH